MTWVKRVLLTVYSPLDSRVSVVGIFTTAGDTATVPQPVGRQGGLPWEHRAPLGGHGLPVPS